MNSTKEENIELQNHKNHMKKLEEIAKYKDWAIINTSKDFIGINFIRIKKDDLELLLRTDFYNSKNKIEIIGKYPKDANGNFYSSYDEVLPKMNVSIDKSAEQIWKDINRRLMPSYVKHLTKALNKKAESEYANEQRNKIEKEIANIMQKPYEKSTGKNIPVYSKYINDDYEYSRVEAKVSYSGEYVKLNIDVSSQKALDILKLLQ